MTEWTSEFRLKLAALAAGKAMNILGRQHRPSEVLHLLQTIEFLAKRSEWFLEANKRQILEDCGLEDQDG